MGGPPPKSLHLAPTKAARRPAFVSPTKPATDAPLLGNPIDPSAEVAPVHEREQDHANTLGKDLKHIKQHRDTPPIRAAKTGKAEVRTGYKIHVPSVSIYRVRRLDEKYQLRLARTIEKGVQR